MITLVVTYTRYPTRTDLKKIKGKEDKVPSTFYVT